LTCDNNDLTEIDTQLALMTLPEIKGLIGNQEPTVCIEPDEVGDRCFSLLGGRVIFGLLIGEIEDSFLVALASSLVSTDGIIDGKLLTTSPVIRLFKNGVAFMSIPESEHRVLYYKHILRLTEYLPEFFTPERFAKIEETIAIESVVENVNQPLSSPDSDKEESPTNEYSLLYDKTTRH
jgi:hypothetical protein